MTSNFIMKKLSLAYKVKRWFRFLYQRVTRGFSDRDTWNLDVTFAEFMLPRLERFMELYHSNPDPFPGEAALVAEEMRFRKDIEEAIWALRFYSDDVGCEHSMDDFRRAEKGLMLLAQRFGQLWD